MTDDGQEMTKGEHQREAERLLRMAEANQALLANGGTQLVQDMDANLRVIDQQVAMAHVHALLAR